MTFVDKILTNAKNSLVNPKNKGTGILIFVKTIPISVKNGSVNLMNWVRGKKTGLLMIFAKKILTDAKGRLKLTKKIENRRKISKIKEIRLTTPKNAAIAAAIGTAKHVFAPIKNPMLKAYRRFTVFFFKNSYI